MCLVDVDMLTQPDSTHDGTMGGGRDGPLGIPLTDGLPLAVVEGG